MMLQASLMIKKFLLKSMSQISSSIEGTRKKVWPNRKVVAKIIAVSGTLEEDVFFFQAEDGIRDRNVTGVQTCALPIFGANQQTASRGAGSPGRWIEHEKEIDECRNQGLFSERLLRQLHHERDDVEASSLCRSEERRVGKERRAREEGRRVERTK